MEDNKSHMEYLCSILGIPEDYAVEKGWTVSKLEQKLTFQQQDIYDRG